MAKSRKPLDDSLREKLVEYCYDIIHCMHTTYKGLSAGLPEPIYQEALLIALQEMGYSEAVREYHHFPTFMGKRLSSHIQLDLMVPKKGRNIVIECKSISKLGDKERLQLYGYLRATEFPVGILVNFGSIPKAEIERYYYDKESGTITTF
ncbi:MAG: GxxExxY protein [Bacteroidales bacterium]|nr:GxxExxY protein [Bacteroidales bacterium]